VKFKLTINPIFRPVAMENTTISFVVGSEKELGEVTQVSLMWTYHSYCMWYCDGDLTIDNVIVKNMTNE